MAREDDDDLWSEVTEQSRTLCWLICEVKGFSCMLQSVLQWLLLTSVGS